MALDRLAPLIEKQKQVSQNFGSPGLKSTTIYMRARETMALGMYRVLSSHQVHMGLMQNSGCVVSRRAKSVDAAVSPLYRKIQGSVPANSLSGPKETQISQTPKRCEWICPEMTVLT